MLLKSRLMNPHKSNSNSHSYRSDRLVEVLWGTQRSQKPASHVCTSLVGCPCSAHLQTHPALQWTTTAAKHQPPDGAARARRDG